MISTARWITLILALAALASVPAWGHGHHRHHCSDGCGSCVGNCGDCGPGAAGCRGYRSGTAARTETSVSGTISELSYLPGANPESAMVELVVQTGERELRLRLSPVSYLKESGATLKEGTSIEARGYRVDGFDGPVLVVTSLKAGDISVELRDSRGRPLW